MKRPAGQGGAKPKGGAKYSSDLRLHRQYAVRRALGADVDRRTALLLSGLAPDDHAAQQALRRIRRRVAPLLDLLADEEGGR
jgi:hypothetical protein